MVIACDTACTKKLDTYHAMVIACDTACTKKLQRHVPDYIIEKNFILTDGNCNVIIIFHFLYYSLNWCYR